MKPLDMQISINCENLDFILTNVKQLSFVAASIVADITAFLFSKQAGRYGDDNWREFFDDNFDNFINVYDERSKEMMAFKAHGESKEELSGNAFKVLAGMTQDQFDQIVKIFCIMVWAQSGKECQSEAQEKQSVLIQ